MLRCFWRGKLYKLKHKSATYLRNIFSRNRFNFDFVGLGITVLGLGIIAGIVFLVYFLVNRHDKLAKEKEQKNKFEKEQKKQEEKEIAYQKAKQAKIEARAKEKMEAMKMEKKFNPQDILSKIKPQEQPEKKENPKKEAQTNISNNIMNPPQSNQQLMMQQPQYVQMPMPQPVYQAPQMSTMPYGYGYPAPIIQPMQPPVHPLYYGQSAYQPMSNMTPNKRIIPTLNINNHPSEDTNNKTPSRKELENDIFSKFLKNPEMEKKPEQNNDKNENTEKKNEETTQKSKDAVNKKNDITAKTIPTIKNNNTLTTNKSENKPQKKEPAILTNLITINNEKEKKKAGVSIGDGSGS